MLSAVNWSTLFRSAPAHSAKAIISSGPGSKTSRERKKESHCKPARTKCRGISSPSNRSFSEKPASSLPAEAESSSNGHPDAIASDATATSSKRDDQPSFPVEAFKEESPPVKVEASYQEPPKPTLPALLQPWDARKK